MRWCTEGDVVLGQTCQPVGSLCYRKGYKIGDDCCGHLKCRPLYMYDASGNVHHLNVMYEGDTPYTASNDFWYCQYRSGGAEGQSCVSID